MPDVGALSVLTPEELRGYLDLDVLAFVAVPLIKGGRYVAGVCMQDSTPRDWTAAEVALIQEVAERTWAAVERARAEEALRESLARYRLLFERATDGIWIADQEGRFVNVNPTVCGILGYSCEEHLRLIVGDIVRKEDTPRLRGLMRQLAAGRQITDIWEIRRADGTYITLELSHVFTHDGLWQAIGRDMTERRRAEEQRQRLMSREAAMRAETAERERISRELHDRVAHSMGVVYQSLQLHKALAADAPGRAEEKLAVAEETARSVLDQTRNLAIELRRSVAEETQDGITPALRTLLQTSAPDGVAVELSSSGSESLVSPDVGTQIYLVMREAIRNSLKQLGCGELAADLEIHPDGLLGTVTDDGKGSTPKPLR